MYTDEYGDLTGPCIACSSIEKAIVERDRRFKEQDEEEEDLDKYHYYLTEVAFIE